MRPDHETLPSGDDEIIGALRREYLRPPPAETQQRQLDELTSLTREEVEADLPPRTRLAPQLVAVAASLVFMAAVSWLAFRGTESVRLEAADDERDQREVTSAPALVGSSISTLEASEEVVDSTVLVAPDSPSGNQPTSSAPTSTIEPGSSLPGPDTSARPTTTATTTPSSNSSTSTVEPTGSTATTSPPTTDTTVPSSIPIDQLRMQVAWLAMIRCLEPSGYPWVGFAMISDHPLASDPGYRLAVETCDASIAMTVVLSDFEAWGNGRTPAQKAEHNALAASVRDCVVAQGWNLGLQPNGAGMLAIVRFPEVSVDQWPAFEQTLYSCGWLDLILGG